MTALKQALPAEHLAPLVANLTEMREAIIASGRMAQFLYYNDWLPVFILISTAEVESFFHIGWYCAFMFDRYVEH